VTEGGCRRGPHRGGRRSAGRRRARAPPEVGLDKFIAATLWSLDNRGVPVVGLLPNASRAPAILQDGVTLIAPDFLIAEVCNAAWRSARLGRVSLAQLGEIAANLPRFFDALVSATVLAPRAVAIAGRLDHPVYDCLYLALAEAAS
jgi:hypothetical protein